MIANVMTSSRVIRGTKAKIFFCVSGVLIVTGLIAIYQNALSQLDETRKNNVICSRQNEHFSMQIRVLGDNEKKLEEALKREVAQHQKKITEENLKNEKVLSDSLLEFSALKQHCDLLKTEYADFQEECSKTQKEQLDEINSLQAKLKEANKELKKVQESREQVKTRFVEQELENKKLKIALSENANNKEAKDTISFFSNKFHDLEDKYNVLQKKCEPSDRPSAAETNVQQPENNNNKAASEKSSLNLPAFKAAEQPSSSTKAGPKASSQHGNLIGAKPIILPNVTMESAKKDGHLKPPQGVPAVPVNREDQNEQPPETQQDRDKIGKEEPENENVAKEVVDQSQNNVFDDLALGDMGQNLDRKEESLKLSDNKKHDDPDYKDIQREEDEDDDVYPDNRQADPVVRN